MGRHRAEITGMPGTGGEFAAHLIENLGIEGVNVEQTQPWGDHYSPTDRAVRLSPANFTGKSLTAIAVAAHEVGHAMQDRDNDPLLARRTSLVPLMRLVERAALLLLYTTPFIALILRTPAPIALLAVGGLGALFARVVLHAITLPVEIDASFTRALPVILEGRYVAPGEEEAIRQVLQAAAFTYVASALADILSIWRWLLILRR